MNERTKSLPSFHADGFNYVRLSADRSTTAGEVNVINFCRRMAVARSNSSRVAVIAVISYMFARGGAYEFPCVWDRQTLTSPATAKSITVLIVFKNQK